MINKAIVVGRVGKIESGQAGNANFCKITVATNEVWKDKQTGEKQEKTTWHNVNGYFKLAEVMEKYAHVGDVVYIEGRMSQKKYTDKTGIERISHSITVDEFKILNSKSKENTSQQKPKNVNFSEDDHLLDGIPF